MTWSRSIDEDLAANAITWMDLAGNDRTIVGVGYRTIGELTGFNQLPSGGIVPAVWTSTDGLTWNPVPEGAIPLDPEETQLDGTGSARGCSPSP